MTVEGVQDSGSPTGVRLSVELSPTEVDVAGELSLSARATCANGCDLRGQDLLVLDEAGTEVARVKFVDRESEEGGYLSDTAVFRAPSEVGRYRYTAVLAPLEREGERHAGASTELAFEARPHAVTVSVWGVPAAITVGERFSFKAGIKCSSGCNLAGRELTIFDQAGEVMGSAKVGEQPSPGTKALYFAELEAQAPAIPGDYRWQISIPESTTGLAHAAGTHGFLVRVVPVPDFEVTVQAIDHEKQTPVKGAHVLMHPYRAFTDENGVVKIKVTRGSYKVFVTGFNYIGFNGVVDVEGDVAVTAELVVEKEVDPYDATY